MKYRKTKKQVKVASSLDGQTCGYFKRVEDVINDDDFKDEESRKLFVENVFTQVQNNEMKLFCDLSISRTMEKLAFYFTDIQIRKIFQNIEAHFYKIAMDKCGSHVLQTLIFTIPKAIRSERSKGKDISEEDKDVKSAEEFFLSLCNCLQENLPELISHIYGSHIVRAAFKVLGGVKVSDSICRGRASHETREGFSHMEEKKKSQVWNAFESGALKPMEVVAVPESFPPVLKHFTKIIIKMELQKLVLHPVSSPLLQMLLLVLHTRNHSLCMKLCKAVMSQMDMFSSKAQKIKGPRTPKDDDQSQRKDEESNYRVPVLLSNEISSHMIEKILRVVTAEIWQEIYECYFDKHLPQLAFHPIANFLVQRLMVSVTEKSQAKQMVKELLPCLEDLLAQGHMGVPVRMVEMAVRFGTKQKKILKALLQAFHCEEKAKQLSAAVLISSLTTYDMFYGSKPNETNGDEKNNNYYSSEEEAANTAKLQSVNFHGALLLKALFDFQDPSKVTTSLLSLSLQELMILSNDKMGSYAVEAFLKSKSVASEKKQMFIEKLKGTFPKLSCEKHGSHVVEACWRNAEVKYKKAITEELALNEQQLQGNFYGKMVLRTCGVEHFKRKDKTWHEKEQKAAKKRKLLEEILEERGDGTARTEKTPKQPAETNFTQLAPEMAALGFTSGGKRTRDSEQNADIHGMDRTTKEPKRSEGKKSELEKCAKYGSGKTHDLSDLEFLDKAVKATKAVKKLAKGKRKKKPK